MKTFYFLFFMLLAPMARADLTLIQLIETFSPDGSVRQEHASTFVSGKRIRFDQGQSISSIILNDQKVTFSIMHEGRKYVSLAHDSLDVPVKKEEATLDSATIENTGKSEVISGVKCHLVRVKEKDGSLTEVWVAEEGLEMKQFLAEFTHFSEFGMAYQMSSLEKHPELKGVPMRVTEFEGGKPLRSATIQKIDTAKIPASTFEIPAGYAEVKINDFGPVDPNTKTSAPTAEPKK